MQLTINTINVIAFLISFNKIFPLPLIAIHYTVVSTWIGGDDCPNMGRFFTYWSFMMILSGLYGFALHWPLKISGQPSRKIYLCIWKGILSALIFMTWSFIRAKPFKCLDSGHHLTYVFGPPLFWGIHVVAGISSAIMISQYKSAHLENFVRLVPANEDV